MDKKAKKELAKLAKLQQQIEKAKQVKRNELLREIKAQSVKRKKLEDDMMEMMLKIKEPILKKQLKIMWKTFERAYDKKNFLIEHTDNLIQEAEDQSCRALSSFCETVDYTINKFFSDFEVLKKENDAKTAALLANADKEVAQIKALHFRAEKHLHLLIYESRKRANDYLWNTRGENFVKRDDEESNYGKIIDDLRKFLENTYMRIWEQYTRVMKNYVIDTAENIKKVRILRRKDAETTDLIALQAKKLASSDDVVKKLRKDLAVYESGEKQAAFRDRRDRYRHAWAKLKQRMMNGCELDRKRLELLVCISERAITWLSNASQKAERILRITNICRKFETEQEKVLPFQTDQPHKNDAAIDDPLLMSNGLLRFWQRINKVKLIKRALLREKEILQRENEAIMIHLNKYTGNQFKLTVCKCRSRNIRKRAEKINIDIPPPIKGVKIPINYLEYCCQEAKD